MKIKIAELKEISDALFRHLEELKISEVEVSDDYFWHIDKENRYNSLQDPTGFSIGQLSDDWANLQSISTGDSPPISYAFVWLSSILLAVGEEVVH